MHRPRTRNRSLLLAAVATAALVVASTPLHARDRIDRIELRSGDRVTCEIIDMRSRSLNARTLDLGTVAIDWVEVTAIISPQLFEVELVNGARIVGSFAKSEEPGSLVVNSANGALGVRFADVAGIVQIGRTIWQGRRGHLDLGLEFTSAKQDLQFSLGAQLELRTRRFRSISSVTAVISDSSETEQRTRGDIRSALDVPLSRHWVFTASGILERNDDLGLEGRLTGSGAGVWIPRRYTRGYWGLGAGLAQSEERYTGQTSSTTSTAGMLLLVADYDHFGPFGTQASFNALYLPMLSGPERRRVEVRGYLRQKVTVSFTFTLSPFYSYDSRPPQGGLKSQDWGVVSAIGWNF
jgi:hypothetical protein